MEPLIKKGLHELIQNMMKNTAENGGHRDTFSESDTEGIPACMHSISSSDPPKYY